MTTPHGLTRTPELTPGALASVVVAGVAIAVHASEPFAHGGWLIAYLLLVGFLAQLLLGVGQARLLMAEALPHLARRMRLAQALLWNVGVVAVPVGVLGETRVAVVVGSVSFAGALFLLGNTARHVLAGAGAAPSWLACSYTALLIAMTASVFVGTALAWTIPWT